MIDVPRNIYIFFHGTAQSQCAFFSKLWKLWKIHAEQSKVAGAAAASTKAIEKRYPSRKWPSVIKQARPIWWITVPSPLFKRKKAKQMHRIVFDVCVPGEAPERGKIRVVDLEMRDRWRSPIARPIEDVWMGTLLCNSTAQLSRWRKCFFEENLSTSVKL